MENASSTITIQCIPPKGYRGDVTFIFGINDEKIGEGKANECVSLTVPSGNVDLFVMVSNGTLNSLSGTTRISASDGGVYRPKYSLFTKNIVLKKLD